MTDSTSFDKKGFYREIGIRLQLARTCKHLTQADVAKELSMPRSSYANVEGGRQRVDVYMLWRAAVILGLHITELIPEQSR